MKNLSSTEIRENEQANILRSIARKKLNLSVDPETEREKPKEKNQVPEILENELPDFSGLKIPASLKLYDRLFVIDLPLYIEEQFKGLENNFYTSTSYLYHLKTLKDIHEILIKK